MYISKLKMWIILLICGIGIVLTLPNFSSSFGSRRINLGLELQGGSYLKMEAALDKAQDEELTQIMAELRKVLRKNRVKFKDLSVKNKKISVKANDVEGAKIAIRTISRSITIDEQDGTISAYYDEITQKEKDKRTIAQCIEVVRNRVDETGTKEVEIYPQGNGIILQLPGVGDPAEIKKLIGQTARLSLKRLVGAYDENTPLKNNQEVLSEKDKGTRYVVEKDVLLTGDVIEKVSVGDKEGIPAVQFSMTDSGAQKFYKITLDSQGKQFAFVLDDKIVSIAGVDKPIIGGDALIAGNMNVDDANRLRILLSAGSLPAELKVVEERVVGPSLGADSIQDGKRAVLVSFGIVTAFMILMYRLLGLFSCISLVFNLVLLFGGLSFLGATLTLPGIAGIALTIGMAVDANVLIYERIKEELRLGVKPIRAIAAGFRGASTAIIDGNLTTLICAAVLYEFGSGPIRGFAVTLSLGIVVSMFTALALTYLQIYLYARNRKLGKVL